MAVIAFGAYYSWAECVCLRSLEEGRSTFGGATVVWVAFALLGLQIIVDWVVAKLPEAFPDRFHTPDTRS